MIAVALGAFSPSPSLADELAGVTANLELAAWRRSHPAAKCKPYRSIGFTQNADEQFCSRCTQKVGTTLVEWSFYAFDVGMTDCVLYQVRTRGDDGQMVVAARSPRLAQEDDVETEMDVIDYMLSSSSPDIEAIERGWAALADYPELESELDPAQARRLLARLIRAANKASGEQRALLLFAADGVAARYGPKKRRPYGGAKASAREVVEGRKLSWTWSWPRRAWVHDRQLLWLAWRDHPATLWGGEAYLMLQREGFSPRGVCTGGAELFREVISRGEKFLADVPSTPVRAEIEFSLGRAYETWWSLARASDDDDHVVAADYTAGAGAARKAAVKHYRAFLGRVGAQTDDGPRIAYVERRLARLELGHATTQRAYFCIGGERGEQE